MLGWTNPRLRVCVWMVTELANLGHWDCSPQVKGRVSSRRPMSSGSGLPRGLGSALLLKCPGKGMGSQPKASEGQSQLNAALGFQHTVPTVLCCTSGYGSSTQIPPAAGTWTQTWPLAGAQTWTSLWDCGGKQATESACSPPLCPLQISPKHVKHFASLLSHFSTMYLFILTHLKNMDAFHQLQL